MNLLADRAWMLRRVGPGAQLALVTFGILVLELAIIRWSAGQIRLIAYFTNLVLIAAFLGMGLGIVLGRRRPGLLHFTLPALAVLSLVLVNSERLLIMHLGFPDTSVSLWGAEAPAVLRGFLLSLSILGAFFWLVAGVFLCAGSAVGVLFAELKTLRSYSWDLAGSLVGVVLFAGLTWLRTGPHVWLLAGALPFVILSRRWWSWLSAVAIVACGWVSVDGAIFSPYNRIDLGAIPVGRFFDYHLSVNRDYHQRIRDLSDAALADSTQTPTERTDREATRLAYDIPFITGGVRDRALVVGAGTGNDVQAALRNGYQFVASVDIDGSIVQLGRELHPERPYADRRTHVVVDDARSYLEGYSGSPFDVICYGLLDSHAMFSAMSTLRLDNYVYTVEGLRAAWEHLSPTGHLSVSFSVFAGPWIADRIYWTLAEATGQRPIIINHGMDWGYTFLVPIVPNSLDLTALGGFDRATPSVAQGAIRLARDDWPFLYIRPHTVPTGYLALLAFILVSGFLGVQAAFGRQALRESFDFPLFFMGAAFLLLETRSVVNLSLLYGSTWMVNASVFAGVLVMALSANLWVERRQPASWRPWFIPLMASVVLLFLVRPAGLSALGPGLAGVVGGLINALPIGFAGIIVSLSLARSRNPTASLGSNLLGALLGGCLEYLSMWVGLSGLTLLVLVFYGLAWIGLSRGAGGAEPAPGIA